MLDDGMDSREFESDCREDFIVAVDMEEEVDVEEDGAVESRLVEEEGGWFLLTLELLLLDSSFRLLFVLPELVFRLVIPPFFFPYPA